MGVHRGRQNGHFPALEIGTKKQNYFESLKLAPNFREIHLIVAMAVYLPVYNIDNHTAQEPGSLFWWHAIQ